MTPRELDWLANGVPVRIYFSPATGKHYASIHDHGRFGVMAIDTIRVQLIGLMAAERPWTEAGLLADPSVVKRLAELNRGPLDLAQAMKQMRDNGDRHGNLHLFLYQPQLTLFRENGYVEDQPDGTMILNCPDQPRAIIHVIGKVTP